MPDILKIVGMVYAIVAFCIITYLMYKSRFNKKVGYMFLTISTIIGFVVYAPMYPDQFQWIILRNESQLGVPILMPIIGLIMFIILTFVFGRTFCGYLCPIGATQEVAYIIPTKKAVIGNELLLIIFRLITFLVFIILGVFFTMATISYLGFRDFFNLNVMSIYFYFFLTVVVISIFIYRPFCRLFCPYGALLSLTSIKSRLKLRRNDNCIDCKKCEKICPTNEANRLDLKQECYVCNRCKEVCPVNAIEYCRMKVKS